MHGDGGEALALPQGLLLGYVDPETIFGAKMMLLGGQTTEFHMHEYLPFLPKQCQRLQTETQSVR